MKRAIVLVAHGTIESTDDLPEFLRAIRHGRDAPPELLEEMRRRYDAIGRSPLLDITRSLAKKLENRTKTAVFVAMRLSKPWLADVLAEVARKFDRAFVLPLAQYSTHVYAEAARASRGSLAIEVADLWGRTPALLDAYAHRVREAMAAMDKEKTLLVLTAHSLPKSVIDAGDPYEREFLASAAGVIERVNDVAPNATHAYQSAGAGGGPLRTEWLGPDLDDVLRNANAERVVVCPIGFLADHLETLYDIDIAAKNTAKSLKIELFRTPSLNDSDDFVEVLAGLAGGPR